MDYKKGDWGLFSVLLALGIAIVILSASAATGAFIAPPPAGWGLDDRNPFQPPGGTHNYPPAYDLLQPRRTCFADRPGFMMSQPPKSTRAELTQLAVVPKTQAGGFLQPDGNIDLYAAYAEVMRRETAIGCEDFDCSFERFTDLSTENGETTTTSTREAISILEGEMRGLYENSRRLYYGPGIKIKGPDFGVDGIGEYENITHAETKGPVGSAINKAQGGKGDLWEQGKEIAKKTRWQKRYWSNKTKTDQLPLIRPDAYLPKSVDNILGLHDLYDVPTEEKSIMNDAIINYSRNDTNTIILNNETNI